MKPSERDYHSRSMGDIGDFSSFSTTISSFRSTTEVSSSFIESSIDFGPIEIVFLIFVIILLSVIYVRVFFEIFIEILVSFTRYFPSDREVEEDIFITASSSLESVYVDAVQYPRIYPEL